MMTLTTTLHTNELLEVLIAFDIGTSQKHLLHSPTLGKVSTLRFGKHPEVRAIVVLFCLLCKVLRGLVSLQPKVP